MNKKNSIFSLADIITLVAALVYGFICFMGANFMNINSEKVWSMSRIGGCIAISVFCAGALFITAWGAKLLKRTKKNHKENRLLEVVCLVLFGSLSLIFISSISPFTHYFTVSSKSEDINDKIAKTISHTESMFEQYEALVDKRIYMYQGRLRAVLGTDNPNKLKHCKLISSPVSPEEQLKTRIEAMRMDLLPPHYSNPTGQNGIKEVAQVWLNEAKKTTEKWKPIGIVSVVREIDQNSEDWKDILSNLYIEGEQPCEEMDPPAFEHKKKPNRITLNFSQSGTPSFLSVVLALILNVLMLFSWYQTKRDPKGYAKLMPYEVEL